MSRSRCMLYVFRYWLERSESCTQLVLHAFPWMVSVMVIVQSGNQLAWSTLFAVLHVHCSIGPFHSIGTLVGHTGILKLKHSLSIWLFFAANIYGSFWIWKYFIIGLFGFQHSWCWACLGCFAYSEVLLCVMEKYFIIMQKHHRHTQRQKWVLKEWSSAGPRAELLNFDNFFKSKWSTFWWLDSQLL